MQPAERVALAGFFVLLLLVRRYAWSSEADADELSMLRGSPPVRIRLPGHIPPGAGRFSRWRCVGDLEDPASFVRRTCIFEHVCYDTADEGDFVFFGRPDNESVPVLYDHRRGVQRKFRQRKASGDASNADFVALSKWVRHKHHHASSSWAPRVVPGPVPEAHEVLHGLHALSAPFVPTNLGHVAWDEAFPLLVGMAQLGEYTRTLTILRTQGCDALPTPSSRLVCAKFEQAFVAPLLGDSGASLRTLAQLRAERPKRLLCFDKLLVGGSFDAFNSELLNEGKEPLLHLYRARVLAWHGVPPAATPRQHQLLLVHKQGKRGIANFKRVHAYLHRRFSPVAAVLTTSYAGLSMAEQFRLLAETTVAISPCGGVSMILPFLPQGAYAVLLNYMLGADEPQRHGECQGCSWTMEAELWRHVRHVHKMYYQVFGDDDFAKGAPGRDAALRVDPQRLGGLVQAALHEMEPY